MLFDDKMKPIYLDHAATTPLAEDVFEAMLPFFKQQFANPSASYQIAQQAAASLALARKTTADVLNCEPSSIVFTGSATESNNLALQGLAQKAPNDKKHILLSPIEHPSVRQTLLDVAQKKHFEVSYVPTDPSGLINLDSLSKAIRPDTCLISIAYASSEVGTVQPIAEICGIAAEHGVKMHCDAVAAANFLPLDVQQLGVDSLSLSGHKIYGPKGIALLYVKPQTPLAPLLSGGAQEHGLRAGTENLALIVGFSKALTKLCPQSSENQKIALLSQQLKTALTPKIPNAKLSGHPTQRLPNHLSYILPNIPSAELLIHLDLANICAASGTACSTGNEQPSPVLETLGFTPAEARSSLRLTLGQLNAESQIQHVAEHLHKIIHQLRLEF